MEKERRGASLVMSRAFLFPELDRANVGAYDGAVSILYQINHEGGRWNPSEGV
jgi:hypothetical protein